MSMLDRFSRYNQVLTAKEDKYKNEFTTPWGMYSFNRMLFGLNNVGATFQRVVDHALKDLIGKIMVDYQDDLMVHSNIRELHFKYLREVFVRCMFGISLNLKKCLFAISKG